MRKYDLHYRYKIDEYIMSLNGKSTSIQERALRSSDTDLSFGLLSMCALIMMFGVYFYDEPFGIHILIGVFLLTLACWLMIWYTADFQITFDNENREIKVFEHHYVRNGLLSSKEHWIISFDSIYSAEYVIRRSGKRPYHAVEIGYGRSKSIMLAFGDRKHEAKEVLETFERWSDPLKAKYKIDE